MITLPSRPCRTEAEVDRLMKFAKLEREELLDTVQCLKFVPNLDNDAIKLMEVDKSILEHITQGKQ